MIDIQLLRTDIDALARRLATRGYHLDVAAFKALEDARKSIQTATERLQSQRNALAKQIGQAKAKKDEATASKLMYGSQLLWGVSDSERALEEREPAI